MDRVWWFEQDVFEYKKKGKITIVKNGKILIDNVDDGSFSYTEVMGSGGN